MIKQRDNHRAAVPGRLSLGKSIARNYHPYLFIAPFFILFAIFGLFPYLYALGLSFFKWDGIGPKQWIGFQNYLTLAKDALWWKSLFNSVWLLVVTIINLPIALVLAFIINSKFVRFREFFRAAFFMPIVAAPVAISTVFLGLLGKRFGVLNYVLHFFGINPIAWMESASWMKPSIALVVIWTLFGWNVIIYLAGLQAIPVELYEAARCDGAGTLQVFRRITVPLLWPVINFTLVLSIIGGLQLFDIPWILTANAPKNNAGLTSVMYMYQSGFRYMKFGYAAAISVALFLVIVLFSFLYYRALRSRSGDN